MLEAGRLDFVIIKARIENANRPGIRYEVLRTERLNVLISRANPLAREENMQVENLSKALRGTLPESCQKLIYRADYLLKKFSEIILLWLLQKGK